MTGNPILSQSMKRRMRSYRAPLLITLYVAFLLLVSSAALITLTKPAVSLGNLRAGIESYAYIVVMQFALIVLVAPALTAGSIAGERERQTLDLLLCTRVGSLSIVLGKLFSNVCFLALMIATSLPMMAVTMFFGGINFFDALFMLAFLIVTAFACCTVGIVCSAVFKRTVTATVMAYLAIFALGIVTVIIPLLFQEQQLTEIGAMLSGQTAQAAGMSAVMWRIPKLLLINPAVGLFSTLVAQTNILQRTLGSFLNYRGSYLYDTFKATGSLALINMGVLAGISLVLTFVAALCVKPSKRFGKRKG